MAGNSNSGNRSERRGVKLRRIVTLTPPAAIFVREEARSKYGVQVPSETQINETVDEMLQECARRMEISEPEG